MRNSPTGLRKLAADKVHEAKTFQEKIDKEARPASEEENRKILALLDEGNNLLKEAGKLERLGAAIEDSERVSPRLTSPVGPGHKPMVNGRIVPESPEETAADLTPTTRPANARDFYSLFPKAPRDLGGFHSASEFFDSVAYGLSHPALRPSAAMSGITGSAGGYLVPSPVAAQMWNRAVIESVLLPRVTLYPMEADTLRVCAWDETTLTDTVDAGFTLQFLGELQEATRSTGTMRAIVLQAHRAGIYVQASGELVQDGQNFEVQLTTKLQSALSRGIDLTIVRGDGANKPLGVLSAPCLVSVTKETNQPADTIEYVNVTRMYARMLPSSVRNAVWLVHPSALPQLFQMSLGIGASGVFFPVLDQANGSMSLLGRPVLLCEACSAIGDKGDIIFADLSAVLCGIRQEITVERSNVPGWLANAIDWRCQIRLDAEPALANPITTARGSSLSPFVTLDAR